MMRVQAGMFRDVVVVRRGGSERKVRGSLQSLSVDRVLNAAMAAVDATARLIVRDSVDIAPGDTVEARGVAYVVVAAERRSDAPVIEAVLRRQTFQKRG